MQYRQRSNLKAKPNPSLVDNKMVQIVFQQQITQAWKVQTNDRKQVLAYCLRHLQLSRVCQSFHQLKFFYFLEYQQQKKAIQQIIQTQIKDQQVIQIDQTFSVQKLQLCKNLSKVLWKIIRNRIVKAFSNMKVDCSFLDEDSSFFNQSDDQNIDSYMRFLKLTQNKHIDIAVENLQSVLQKNTRRKLLQAFLNIRGQQNYYIQNPYNDSINVQIFTQKSQKILLKNQYNYHLIKSAFSKLVQQSQYKRRQIISSKRQKKVIQKDQYQQQNESYKKKKKVQIHQSPNIYRGQTNQSNLYNDTLVRNRQRKIIIENDYNQKLTAKRKQSAFYQRQNRNNQIQSQFLYQFDNQHNNYSKDQLPTKRSNTNQIKKYQSQQIIQHHNNQSRYKQVRNYHDNQSRYKQLRNDHSVKYVISDIQNNINSDVIYTKRQSRQYQVNKIKTSRINSQKQSKHHDMHIPITQQLDNNKLLKDHQIYYQSQNKSDIQLVDESQQQIYIIRNFTQRPKSRPDQYVKVPVLSKNINLVEIPAHSNQRNFKSTYQQMSTSKMQQICCQGCQFCVRLRNIQNMLKSINHKSIIINKSQIASKFTIYQNVEQIVQDNKNNQHNNQNNQYLPQSKQFQRHCQDRNKQCQKKEHKQLSKSAIKTFQRRNIHNSPARFQR